MNNFAKFQARVVTRPSSLGDEVRQIVVSVGTIAVVAFRRDLTLVQRESAVEAMADLLIHLTRASTAIGLPIEDLARKAALKSIRQSQEELTKGIESDEDEDNDDVEDADLRRKGAIKLKKV